MSNFHAIEFMSRGIETQLQVAENVKGFVYKYILISYTIYGYLYYLLEYKCRRYDL